MLTLSITNDPEDVYPDGTIISVDDLIADFTENLSETTNFLYRMPTKDAVDYIAKAWGFEYDFV